MREVRHAFPYALSRAAFSPRDAARAGDVWRAFQDVAVTAATLSGWTPRRFRDAKSAFVMRSMTVVHHREADFEEALVGESWVSRVRRETFCTREVRLSSDRGPFVSGTQEWAHLDLERGPSRMPPGMVDELGLVETNDSVSLPTHDGRGLGSTHELRFRTFHTWMDPLGHVNHPQYVDFCEEAIAQRLASVGLDPVLVAPVAESVSYRAAIVADELVTVTTRVEGRTARGAVVFSHRIGTEREPRSADAITVRRLVDGADDSLFEAFS